jgi:signal transduction histidine kinase
MKILLLPAFCFFALSCAHANDSNATDGALRPTPEQTGVPASELQTTELQTLEPAPSEAAGHLIKLVTEAAAMIREKGEVALADFREPGSRWREGDDYIFVLDEGGTMLVHPDPAVEGKNQIELKDVNGKLIVRGLLEAAGSADKPEGWYHYQWPVPGGILPRWKSAFVRRVQAPSGRNWVVGSGTYNDRMERAFVVDAVRNAVAQIEKQGEAAYSLFNDRAGPFLAKDSYIFVFTMDGIELVNPAFPNLAGRNTIDVQDSEGKFLTREIIKTAATKKSGWVDYMWPKPGESLPSRKSAFVSQAMAGGKPVVVGCGVYLDEAPRRLPPHPGLKALELVELVGRAAALTGEKGEGAYADFRKRDSAWFFNGTYVFVFTMDGVRHFHAAEPGTEGRDDHALRDVRGRPLVQMMLEIGASPTGEGWVHYQYPEPGKLFPVWKSSFVKRVTYPSGKQYLVGSGVYNLDMDEVLIKDVVERAALLLEKNGRDAFARLRDPAGPFVFMDTYVFVDTPEGVELVNGGHPSVEGMNFIHTRDLKGKLAAREYIETAMRKGSAWVNYFWYRPGENTPSPKHTYVKKVQHGDDTFIIGAGLYGERHTRQAEEAQKFTWADLAEEKMRETLTRQAVFGQQSTLARFKVSQGTSIGLHSHPNEEFLVVTAGSLKFDFTDREILVRAGELLLIPMNTPHSVQALEDSEFLDFFTPARADWLHKEDYYLRRPAN